MEQKRHIFEIQLNAINDTDNPTRKECEFILHDFSVSHNKAFISKTTAENTLHTLQNMPIVAKYHPVSEPGANDDALGGHEAFLDLERESGDYIVGLNTVPIGVFTEPAYIKTIVNEQGEEIEVVAGKGILWASRFPNVIGLLKEWVDNGVNVTSSMEILYDSYLFKDGVEEILNYVYEGHCILNSSDRGEHKKIYPAYDVSKLTRLVAEAMNQSSNKEEGETMKFKKVFELSHSDVRSLLYGQLDPTLPEGTYSWISDVYDSYFVVNLYSEQEDKYYKFNYTKNDNSVTIDLNTKTEVTLRRDWIEVTQVQQLQAELDQTKTQLNEANASIETLKNEKDSAIKQFNDATEKVTSLAAEVEILKPFKAQYEQEQYEKQLNEKKEYYSAKFQAVGAIDKFETEEVQELVKKSLNDAEATLQLNTMLVELVQVKTEPENTAIREHASRRENLIPTSDDFESRYSL